MILCLFEQKLGREGKRERVGLLLLHACCCVVASCVVAVGGSTCIHVCRLDEMLLEGRSVLEGLDVLLANVSLKARDTIGSCESHVIVIL